jgi:transcriptional regulator with XRE-family HTH domain
MRIFLGMVDLPTTLRVQRVQRRWSQERAAIALGWTFYRYRRIELAFDRPTSTEVEKLAEVFGVVPKALKAAVSATTWVGPGSGEAASVA